MDVVSSDLRTRRRTALIAPAGVVAAGVILDHPPTGEIPMATPQVAADDPSPEEPTARELADALFGVDLTHATWPRLPARDAPSDLRMRETPDPGWTPPRLPRGMRLGAPRYSVSSAPARARGRADWVRPVLLVTAAGLIAAAVVVALVWGALVGSF